MRKAHRLGHEKLLKLEDNNFLEKFKPIRPVFLDECVCTLNQTKEKLEELLRQLAITEDISEKQKLEKEKEKLEVIIVLEEARISRNKDINNCLFSNSQSPK